MPERLYIYCNSATATMADAIIIDDKQRVLGCHLQQPLAAIVTLQQQREVIIIISGLMVKATQVSPPITSATKFKQSLPFMLEDEVAEEIEALHFAFNPKLKTDTACPVVIINKALLASLVQHLAQYQLIADIITTDLLALPPPTDLPWLVATPTYFIYRDQHHSFAFDENLLPRVITQYPNITQAVAFSDSSAALLGILSTYPQICLEQRTINYAQAVAQHLKPGTCIQLNDSSFATSKHGKGTLKLWYSVAGLMAIWLLTSTTVAIINYSVLSKRLTALQAENLQIYRQFFPNANMVISPELRIKRWLGAVSNQPGGELFSLLQRIAPLLSDSHGIKIANLKFADNKIMLNVTAPQFATFELLQKQLQQRKLNVKQLNASSENNHVKASFEVSL